MKFPAICLFVCCAFSASLSYSQAQIEQIRPPTIILADATALPVTVGAAKVESEIVGGDAVTRVELTLRNPNARILEGELQFPLLDGQRIIGMALDIDGRLRDAVPVEKARGQEVFEDNTRRRVDPALLEMTQGNNFKLRVYPIPAKGERRVVIQYAEALTERRSLYLLRLPLAFAAPLERLQVSVRVFGSEAAPTANAAALGKLAFSRRGEVYELDVARENFIGSGVLELAVPAAAHSALSTQSWSGATYFSAQIPVPREFKAAAARLLPKSVALIWDASGSGAQRDQAKVFALLDRYFRALGHSSIRLIRVRDTVEAAEVFQVSDGRWAALRKALETTVYDGATNLGAVPVLQGIDEIILVSDGIANFGAPGLPRFKQRSYAISATPGADLNALEQITDGAGGAAIDLLNLGIDEAADLLLKDGPQLTEIAGEGVGDLLAASRRAQGGMWRVAGTVSGAGRLRVLITAAQGRKRELTLPVTDGGSRSRFAAQAWARLRLAQLDAEYRLHRAEIHRIGQLFRIPTRETSLIVLDRVEDYLRYDIEPPAELKAEYQRLHLVQAAAGKQANEQQIERVVRLFQDRQTWWNKEFPKTDRPARDLSQTEAAAPRREMAVGAAVRADALAETRQAPASPMAAAPAPAPQPAGAARKAAMASASAKTAAAAEPSGATIALKPWTPDASYIARMRDARPDDLYRVYLDERPNWSSSTAFFLDVADLLLERGQKNLALRVLSNLAEMNLENRHILHILGYRLLQAERPDLAVPVLERVLALAPNEPQSWRDLGLAQWAAGDAQKAVDTLYQIALKRWNARFPEIELIALTEMNGIIATAAKPIDTRRIDPRLIRNLPLDLRAVLTWDADNTDIDLWVTDPNGERAFYGNRLSFQGGRMSPDFTGGYGPEEFSLKTAKPGKYRVEANFYGHNQQVVASATTIMLRLQTHFGTAQQQELLVTLRLKGRKENVFVGEFEIARSR